MSLLHDLDDTQVIIKCILGEIDEVKNSSKICGIMQKIWY